MWKMPKLTSCCPCEEKALKLPVQRFSLAPKCPQLLLGEVDLGSLARAYAFYSFFSIRFAQVVVQSLSYCCETLDISVFILSPSPLQAEHPILLPYVVWDIASDGVKGQWGRGQVCASNEGCPHSISGNVLQSTVG